MPPMQQRSPRISIEARPGSLDVEIGVQPGHRAEGLALLREMWPAIAALDQAVRDAEARGEADAR